MLQSQRFRILVFVPALLVVASCTDQPREKLTPQPLQARVIECRNLVYTEGADPEADQPAFVRAGSAVIWFGGRLAVIQDDAHIIALVDTADTRVDALLLPAGEGGVRLFDEGRGNKSLKFDLEAAFVHGESLYAFGSGSSPKRESIVIVGPDIGDPAGRPIQVVRAPALYAAFRSNKAFSGSELNIEGTAVFGDTVRFFQRGNGAPSDGLEPVDATCDVATEALLRYLEDPDRFDPPAITNVREYDLGRLAGVRLTFSDATVFGDHFVFLASAEDSPDAIGDGPVTGVVVGLMPAEAYDPTPRWVQLRGKNGAAFTDKAEGIVLDPTKPDHAFIVTDRDDPNIPAEMCEVILTGFTD